jgi:hypothetical protein
VSIELTMPPSTDWLSGTFCIDITMRLQIAVLLLFNTHKCSGKLHLYKIVMNKVDLSVRELGM